MVAGISTDQARLERAKLAAVDVPAGTCQGRSASMRHAIPRALRLDDVQRADGSFSVSSSV